MTANEPPQIQPVDSTGVALVSYDAATRRLYVRFRGSNRSYVYLDVPPDVYEDLKASSSVGRFVNARIKDRYEFRRID